MNVGEGGKADRPLTVAIAGGGPAGLTAAYSLLKHGHNVVPEVLEAGSLVGGIARTESYKGFRFDIGGHRFFTKVKEVEDIWREILTADFLTRPRKSRIFYRGKYYDYPLRIFNALHNIGPVEAVRVALSYAKSRLLPSREEDTFEQWVSNRFGRRLFKHFFQTYTEKVWGIPCSEIRADWAAQRIQNLSLSKAVWNALTGANNTASLIEQFQYPRLGPGQMWETAAERVVAMGGQVKLHSRVDRVVRNGMYVTGFDVTELSDGEVRKRRVEADHFISTMPIDELIACMDPPPPKKVVAAAGRLRYRDFLIVTLILDHADPFDDNWIYIHSPDVSVGRIQNFRAWSEDLVPAAHRASIGMEYFCHEGDGIWEATDDALIALASEELETLGLANASTVIDGKIIRQRKAYPVYDGEYRDALEIIKDWIGGLYNFQTVGRNGMHRYNNQDHSMLTALLAARNILGESHDIWNVNVERSYHESFTLNETAARATNNERQAVLT